MTILSLRLGATVCAAGSLCATSAFAESNGVVVYGLFDAAMRHVSNADASRASLNTMEDGIITGSRLGFRAREDLGDGLAAVFTMESGFDPSSGVSLQGSPTADFGQVAASSRFWGREIHVGLSGKSWGVRAGRQYTIAHAMSARFQPLGNPNNLAFSIFSSHHVARQDNVLRVDVNLGGVDLAASRTFGEAGGDSSANASWAMSAGYGSAKTFYVGAYVQRMNNLAGTETRKIVGLGGNYQVASWLALYGGAMRRTNATSVQVNKAWTLGANVDVLPLVTLTAAYLRDDQSGSPALEGSRTVGYLTAAYRFSLRTDVYAAVDHNSVRGGYARPAFMGTKGTQDGFTVGLRHRF